MDKCKKCGQDVDNLSMLCPMDGDRFHDLPEQIDGLEYQNEQLTGAIHYLIGRLSICDTKAKDNDKYVEFIRGLLRSTFKGIKI